ncbi:metal ABC transporter ATP-binding protein [Carnobacterium gallinarum]|uniref:metal ABC transporter ATP-binding protein n=1 Tax=Carnobacterium gallinarum TaxID=2749 RepID=UPI00055834D8|nr:metal ABC transporter ATP-binding protein [Carnobacterium gallinarum]
MEIKNLSVAFNHKKVLDSISLDIEEGSLTGIVGPNGAGKSTLIKAAIGLVKSDNGEVFYQGLPIKQMKKQIAYVPQRNEVDLDFPITVKEMVLIGTYPKLGLFRRPNKASKRQAMAALEAVGMEQFAHRQIGQLSGGQLQRVFIARALSQEAELFLLDEPFVGVDSQSETIIIHLLKELVAAGKTIVVVHHDLDKVAHYFDNVILLNQRVIANGTVKQVFNEENLKHTYVSSELLSYGIGGI